MPSAWQQFRVEDLDATLALYDETQTCWVGVSNGKKQWNDERYENIHARFRKFAEARDYFGSYFQDFTIIGIPRSSKKLEKIAAKHLPHIETLLANRVQQLASNQQLWTMLNARNALGTLDWWVANFFKNLGRFMSTAGDNQLLRQTRDALTALNTTAEWDTNTQGIPTTTLYDILYETLEEAPNLDKELLPKKPNVHDYAFFKAWETIKTVYPMLNQILQHRGISSYYTDYGALGELMTHYFTVIQQNSDLLLQRNAA